jgi:hypothetical protein
MSALFELLVFFYPVDATATPDETLVTHIAPQAAAPLSPITATVALLGADFTDALLLPGFLSSSRAIIPALPGAWEPNSFTLARREGQAILPRRSRECVVTLM